MKIQREPGAAVSAKEPRKPDGRHEELILGRFGGMICVLLACSAEEFG